MPRRTRRIRVVTLFLAALLVGSALLLGRTTGAHALAPTLYAVTGAGGGSGCGTSNPSSLYTLDSSTAAETLVGPITISGGPRVHVTGLAFDPATGTLYGWMNGQAGDCSDFAAGTLITIDKTNGDATVVGSVGAAGVESPDMSFDPQGHLFAWSEADTDGARNAQDDLVAVNTSDGTATKVGECNCGTFSTGLAFDNDGRLYLKSGSFLQRLNQFTGHLFGSGVSLDASPQNMLAFGPGNVAYTGTRSGTSPRFTLQTIDLGTGDVTDVGTNEIPFISALAWDLGTSTPAVSDLSLTKSVDDATPDNWGDEVTFTVQVGNGGGDGATGVEVTDVLPSGLTYSGDDGGGAYDSGTGVWTVGSLANGASATLHISATVDQQDGTRTNAAEVTAVDQYDPDSVPGSHEGDTYATATVTPDALVGVDVGVSIDTKGNTVAKGKKKSFDVVVTNFGSLQTFVSSTQLAVTVNGSTNTVSCTTKTLKIKPTKRKRFNCKFSPLTTGVTPGSTVTYAATVNLPTDGFPGDDTGSASVVAK